MTHVDFKVILGLKAKDLGNQLDLLRIKKKYIYLYNSQLAQLLPMEENFLLLFRFDNPLESSVEFMKVSADQPSV